MVTVCFGSLKELQFQVNHYKIAIYSICHNLITHSKILGIRLDLQGVDEFRDRNVTMNKIKRLFIK